jgi:hypothetical protein
MSRSAQFFPPYSESDPAELLVTAIKPSSRVRSSDALQLIEKVTADHLAKEREIDAKMAFVTCALDAEVKRTLGTQCLIYLFDPGNGWCRDYTKRVDMLIMASKLVEKGVRLEGISYYGETIQKNIQRLINSRDDDPPATIDLETQERFAKSGYKFDYSKLTAQNEAAETAELKAGSNPNRCPTM